MDIISRIWPGRIILVIKKAVSGVCWLVVSFYCLLMVSLTVIQLLGFQKFVVVSGSMIPVIPVGSCILVKEKNASLIRSDEILTFYIDNGNTVVTHRVLLNDTENREFVTGGDANSSADAAPVPYEACIGTVRLIIPFLGFLLVFLNSIWGKVFASCLFFFCLGLTAIIKDAERSINAQ